MNNVVELCVTATPEVALKKLAKAQIPVYKLKKQGAYLYFGVNEEYVEKAFAIFAHACYNISIRSKSPKNRLLTFFKRRVGLFIGGALFVAVCLLSGGVLFKIKVTGSGYYLKDEILALAKECGAREWSFAGALDKPLLQAKIMALPNVNFCSVQREGSYLIIEVNAEADNTSATDYKPLTSSCNGVVHKIVTVCGTPEKEVGDSVKEGDLLIGAYTVSESGEKIKCIAVGYAQILRQASLTLFFDEESEENTKRALTSTSLYAEETLEKSYFVKRCEGGVNYTVNFTYLITLAVNMQ